MTRICLFALVAFSLYSSTFTYSQTGSALPPVGIAVEHPDGSWCAEFPSDARPSLAEGTTISIVFPEANESLVWTAQISVSLRGECQTAFPQPRWNDYVAFRLLLPDARPSASASRKSVGLAIAGPARWSRNPQGRLRADLDGDGLPEEARRCAADEGEHFTLWSLLADWSSERRAHEYFDWGALVDRTCQPGEDGRDLMR